MKEVIGHIYGSTKEQVKEITDIISNAGYEIAYENEQRTSVSVIKDIVDEQAD
jgi:hypothetical protein